MLKALRLHLVRHLIDINECLIFERRLRKFYTKKFEGGLDLILDVGSNKGQTIDFFLKLNPACTIFGFEPNKLLYQKLLLKYRHLPNIKLFNLGVSDKAGTKVFHENILDYTSSFEQLNLNSEYLKTKSRVLGVKPEGLIKKSYLVEVVTLSEFIETHIHEPIDLLKIDTEGHEYACLLGLFNQPLNPEIRYVQLENHNDDMYLHKISFGKTTDLLLANNFKPASVIKHGFGDLDEVIFRNTCLKRR